MKTDISLQVNNGRRLVLSQLQHDSLIYVQTKDSDGNTETMEHISPGDLTTMLNWYRYQKDNGNENLMF